MCTASLLILFRGIPAIIPTFIGKPSTCISSVMGPCDLPPLLTLHAEEALRKTIRVNAQGSPPR